MLVYLFSILPHRAPVDSLGVFLAEFRFVADLPKTISGKIRRVELRDLEYEVSSTCIPLDVVLSSVTDVYLNSQLQRKKEIVRVLRAKL